MNKQDSIELQKKINTIEFAQKTNTSLKFFLLTLQHNQYQLWNKTVHRNSLLHFRLDVNIVEF